MTDGALRRKALEALGDYADPLARDAVSSGALEVAPDIATWEGTNGTIRGYVVVVVLDAERFKAVSESPPAQDAIAKALAIAVSGPVSALYDVRYVLADPPRPSAGPYRRAP